MQHADEFLKKSFRPLFMELGTRGVLVLPSSDDTDLDTNGRIYGSTFDFILLDKCYE